MSDYIFLQASESQMDRLDWRSQGSFSHMTMPRVKDCPNQVSLPMSFPMVPSARQPQRCWIFPQYLRVLEEYVWKKNVEMRRDQELWTPVSLVRSAGPRYQHTVLNRQIWRGAGGAPHLYRLTVTLWSQQVGAAMLGRSWVTRKSYRGGGTRANGETHHRTYFQRRIMFGSSTARSQNEAKFPSNWSRIETA